MLYEACVETIDGTIQSVPVEGRNKAEARMAAISLRFVSRRSKDPVIYIRRITEDEYLSFEDDIFWDRLYFGESA